MGHLRGCLMFEFELRFVSLNNDFSWPKRVLKKGLKRAFWCIFAWGSDPSPTESQEHRQALWWQLGERGHDTFLQLLVFLGTPMSVTNVLNYPLYPSLPSINIILKKKYYLTINIFFSIISWRQNHLRQNMT